MKFCRLLCFFPAFFLLPSVFAQAPPPAFTAANNPLKGDVEQNLSNIKLPAGFSIALYASGMEEARSMAMGDDGTLYVGTRGAQGAPALVRCMQYQMPMVTTKVMR